MSATPTPNSTPSTAREKKPNKFWLELGPLLAFFAAFQYFKRANPDEAMVWAAGILAVLASLALSYSWLKHKYVSGVLILTTVLVVVFAGLTFFTGNKVFLFMKPTIVNTLFGLGVIGGALMGKNVLKMFLGEAFELPDAKWNSLAMRWGIFFFAMAILNELIWRNFSEDFWIKFKVFGFMPLTLIFTLSQLPFIQKHGKMRGAP